MKIDREAVLYKTLRDLAHSHVSVRIHAAKMLSWIGDESVVSPLIEALKDPNEGVRFQAAKSLRKLTPQDWGQNYDEWRRWFSESRNA